MVPSKLNYQLKSSLDASDIEKVLPGKLNEVFTFLRDYKIPDGKPANTFAFDGALKDKVKRYKINRNNIIKAFALNVVNETHEDWHKLVSGKVAGKGISTYKFSKL